MPASLLYGYPTNANRGCLDLAPRSLNEVTAAMMRRTLNVLLLIAALAAVPLFGRDWNQCPAVVTLQTTEVVYALGDPHDGEAPIGGVPASCDAIVARPRNRSPDWG